jgi:hypothetical protein
MRAITPIRAPAKAAAIGLFEPALLGIAVMLGTGVTTGVDSPAVGSGLLEDGLGADGTIVVGPGTTGMTGTVCSGTTGTTGTVCSGTTGTTGTVGSGAVGLGSVGLGSVGLGSVGSGAVGTAECEVRV